MERGMLFLAISKIIMMFDKEILDYFKIHGGRNIALIRILSLDRFLPITSGGTCFGKEKSVFRWGISLSSRRIVLIIASA